MDVKQIATLANEVFQQGTGEIPLLEENLGNVAAVGKAYKDALGETFFDNYARGVVNKVGYTIWVDRVFQGRTPSLLKRDWEYGSILEKIRCEIPDFVENQSWQLNEGQSYDPNVFTPAKLHAKYWNNKSTFELDISFPEDQLNESLASPSAFIAFWNMVETQIRNKRTKAIDLISMRAVNNMIGITLSGNNSNTKVNLLALYNAGPGAGGTPLTFPACLTNADFLRFAALTMKMYVTRLRDMSVLFNAGGTEKFTPSDRLHTILWDKFAASAGVYLYDANGQFLTDEIKLPAAETVSYWQGSGKTYADADVTKIDVITSEGDDVTQSGILGVMFDDEACCVSNLKNEVRTNNVVKGRFVNYFWFTDVALVNDPDENFVVFYAA